MSGLVHITIKEEIISVSINTLRNYSVPVAYTLLGQPVYCAIKNRGLQYEVLFLAYHTKVENYLFT